MSTNSTGFECRQCCNAEPRACERSQTWRPTGSQIPIASVQSFPPELGLRIGEYVASFYETLEVSPRASNLVIRAAYRCLAQHHHPDKNPDSEGASQRLARINEAYAVLSDTAKRMSYDRGLALVGDRDERRGVVAVRQAIRAPDGSNLHAIRSFAFRQLEPTRKDRRF